MPDKPITWRVREALDLGLPCVARLRPGTRLLLSFLASCADPDGGGIRRSVSTLSRLTGLKPRTLKYRLDELRKAGVLVSEDPGGGRAPAVRRIVLSGAPPCTAGVQDGAPQQCKTVHRSGATSRTAAVHPVAPKVNHEGDLEGDPAAARAREGWPASSPVNFDPRPGANGRPSRNQLDYIRDLASRLGREAPQPRTKGEATALIDELAQHDREGRRLRRKGPTYAERKKHSVEKFIDETIGQEDGQ